MYRTLMDVREIVAQLKDVTDEELFILLDGASEEMKRRNGLLGPSISNIRNNPVEKNVEMVLDALAGVRGKQTGR